MHFSLTQRGLAIVWLGLAPVVARGGTVLTANLPANTAIVNIDARLDGAAAYDGPQDKWYHPFSAQGASELLQYTIQPGTYQFRVINPAAAAAQFPALTTTQQALMFTAWTYNSPWITNYMVWDVAAATNFSLQQIVSGAGGQLGFGSAQAAYDAAVTGNYADELRLPPGGRLTGVLARKVTFPTAQTLVFGIPDSGLSDNGGGISVLISPLSALLGDFDQDFDLDSADYLILVANLHTDVLGLTLQQSALLGDLTADLRIDGQDFAQFRSAFDAANGAGSFVAMLAVVPEPGATTLAAAAAVCLAAGGFCRAPRTRPAAMVRNGKELREPGRLVRVAPSGPFRRHRSAE